MIGIDLGIMLLMAENYRSQSIWTDIMATPEARSAMTAAAFQDSDLI